jgi:hypothetical protein
MNEQQLKTLEKIIKELIASCNIISNLSDPLFGLDAQYIKQVIQIPELFSTFFGQWAKLRELANEVAQNPTSSKDKSIEVFILSAVLETGEKNSLALYEQSKQFIETLTVAAQKNLLEEGQAQQAFAALSKLFEQISEVCISEIGSLKQLCTLVPEQAIKPRINQTPMIVAGQITIGKNKISSEAGELLAEFEPSSASNALSQMRTKYGIVTIKLLNTSQIPLKELALIFNAALNLLERYPLELSVRAVITSLISGKVLLASYYISKEKTIAIRFEQYAPLLIPMTFKTLEGVKEHLISQYKLEAIQEEDAPWQLEELNQVADALNKLAKRPQDVIVLTGCTIIRMKESKDDNPDAKVGGFYTPGMHTLTLTNAAFAANTQRFYGMGKTICPYSHGVILHEVGHIIEFHDWQAQRKQGNEGIQDIEAQLKKQQQLALRLQKQVKEIAIACDQEWEDYQREMNAEQEKRLNAIDEAKQEFLAVREQVQGFRRQAINLYNSACDGAPQDHSQEDRLYNSYLQQLYAMLDALQKINFSDQNLALTALTPALEIWKQVQEARMTFQKTLPGAGKEYADGAYNTQSILGQVLDIAKLYPQIQQEAAQLRLDFKAWLNADELQQQELRRKHAAAIASAENIWGEQENLCMNLMQKSLSTRIGVLKDAQKMFSENTPTPCLKKFLDFVTQHNIAPLTRYAKEEWDKGNKSEFFAEAYHLFLNEPGFLQVASQALSTWFEDGGYI